MNIVLIEYNDFALCRHEEKSSSRHKDVSCLRVSELKVDAVQISLISNWGRGGIVFCCYFQSDTITNVRDHFFWLKKSCMRFYTRRPNWSRSSCSRRWRVKSWPIAIKDKHLRIKRLRNSTSCCTRPSVWSKSRMIMHIKYVSSILIVCLLGFL